MYLRFPVLEMYLRYVVLEVLEICCTWDVFEICRASDVLQVFQGEPIQPGPFLGQLTSHVRTCLRAYMYVKSTSDFGGSKCLLFVTK